MNQSSNTFKRIGFVIRPHGLSGEVVVKPVIEKPEILQSHEIFYLKNKRGDFTPLRVQNSRLVLKSNQYLFFVKFVQVTNRDASEDLKGQDLFLLKEDVLDNMLPEEEEQNYVDYELISTEGVSYGFVFDIIENPAHPILEVIGDMGKILVPVVDAYILSIDDEKKRIIGKNIEQLMQI